MVQQKIATATLVGCALANQEKECHTALVATTTAQQVLHYNKLACNRTAWQTNVATFARLKKSLLPAPSSI